MAGTFLGFDGSVGELEIAQIMAGLDGNGRVASWADWAVTAQPGDRAVSVSAGIGTHAFVRAYFDAPTVLNLPLGADAGRFFYIVARRDWVANKVTFEVIAGDITNTAIPSGPPFALPAGFARDPGTLLDQLIAVCWVSSANTDVLIFDYRITANGERKPRHFPGGNGISFARGNGRFLLSTYRLEGGYCTVNQIFKVGSTTQLGYQLKKPFVGIPVGEDREFLNIGHGNIRNRPGRDETIVYDVTQGQNGTQTTEIRIDTLGPAYDRVGQYALTNGSPISFEAGAILTHTYSYIPAYPLVPVA